MGTAPNNFFGFRALDATDLGKARVETHSAWVDLSCLQHDWLRRQGVNGLIPIVVWVITQFMAISHCFPIALLDKCW